MNEDNTNHHDDPRLTAYALDELSQGEREQVEALLRDDPTARQVVEEIRATANMVTSGLKIEAGDTSLTDLQRFTITKAASHNVARSRYVPSLLSVLAAAAIILVCVGVMLPALSKARSRPQAVSMTHPQNPGAAQPADPSPGDKAPLDGLKRDSFRLNNEVKQIEAQQQGQVQSQPGVSPTLPHQSPVPSIISGAASNTPLSVTGTRLSASGPARQSPSNSPAGDSTDSVLMPGAEPEFRSAPEFNLDTAANGYRDKSSGRFNTESYDRITDNAFLDARQNPLSTFSIDVDTASYSNIRRFINEQSQLPPKDAVRIEEMVNYFPYIYPAPQGDAPFGANIEVAGCPWNSDHRLVRIALKGKEIAKENCPASNLVFLIDVSGSMADQNKLPLLKRSMQRMVRELRENDRVAIVVYAGNSGLVLPSTACDERNQRTILDALEQLQSGGSTNGASGITLAYQVANENFIKNGTNRVILCTDGDFNVGVTNQGDLTRLIEEKAKSNVFLSVLGFGMGNVKDSTMEKLADKGNGNYAYIDNEREANKVLVQQMSGTLVTIAKDVKIQVEFNPAKVGTYRLIGYENRMLAKEDFNDDKKDAGEIGAGHTVTALYEIAPVGAKGDAPAVDPLRYSPNPATKADSNELLTVKLRYKAPDAPIEQGTSKLLEFPVKDSGDEYARASRDFKFASSVAAFGMILRDSQYKGNATFDAVIEMAQEGRGSDEAGYRGEFIELVRKAKTLQRRQANHDQHALVIPSTARNLGARVHLDSRDTSRVHSE